MNNIDIAVERPILFLILVPALLLGIIPFLRIQKRRRASVKHLVPFIIHLSLIFLLSGLLAGITVTETTDERLDTKIVFAVDVSDSMCVGDRDKNIKEETRTQINTFIKNVISESDPDKDKFAIVLFANDIISVVDEDDFDTDAVDFLKFDRTNVGNQTDSTNIGKAITQAATLLNEQKQNKKIIIISDGLETALGADSISIAKKLDEGIQISGVRIGVVSDDLANREIQLVSVNTNGKVAKGEDVAVELVIKCARYTRKVEINVYDGDITRTEFAYDLQPGNNVVRFSYTPEVAGVNTIAASIKFDSTSDLLSQNNILYSWYELEDQRSVLIVDGDYGKVNGQFDQIAKSSVMQNLDGYSVTILPPSQFPKDLSGLLEYDQVVLMDVNFGDLHANAGADLRRYVEEVGRGLFVSFGDSFYDISGEEYLESPIESLLPVHLKLEGEKETVAMVLVVDLSSSMKELMGERSRFEIVVESVKKVIMLGATEEEKEAGIGFSDEDYIGIVCFDENSLVALEMTELGNLEKREKHCEDAEYQLRHYYNHYYLNPDRTESDIPVNKDDGNKYTSMGYIKPSGIRDGQYDKQTGHYIKSSGTVYKWAIQEASEMLNDMESKTMLHIKQVLFMSDGSPSDKGSGYEGIVERMAKGGVTTSTIAAGLDSDPGKQDTQKKELKKIAAAGGGDFYVAETADDLTETIVSKAEEVTAELINERSVLPVKGSYNSNVLEGVREFDIIGGYYTSTIKEGADLIVYVDRKKPLYAEWGFGLGKVAVYMSDLGNEKWTSTLFAEDKTYGNIFVANMLNATMNRQVDSTGLEYSVTRDDTTTTITVNTPVDVRSAENLIVKVYDRNGREMQDAIFTKTAVKRYSAKINTENIEDIYTIKIYLVNMKTGAVNDNLAFAVSGYYSAEYDVFNDEGEARLAGIVGNGRGEVLNGPGGLFNDLEGKVQFFEHDVTTPVIIAVLILFLLDILFRNIVIRRKKDKEPQMTDEEQIASMRGR